MKLIIDKKEDIIEYITALKDSRRTLLGVEKLDIKDVLEEYLEEKRSIDQKSAAFYDLEDKISKCAKYLSVQGDEDMDKEEVSEMKKLVLEQLIAVFDYEYPMEWLLQETLKSETDSKVGLFTHFTRSDRKKLINTFLEKAKEYLVDLENVKTQQDMKEHVTTPMAKEIVKRLLPTLNEKMVEPLSEDEIAKYDHEAIYNDDKKKPEINKSYDACYIIKNLPITSADKADKMAVFVKKQIKKHTTIKSADILNIDVPVNEKKKTKGLAFVEFAKPLSQKKRDALNDVVVQKGNKEKKKKELKLQLFSFGEMYRFKNDDENQYNFKAAAFKEQPFMWDYLKNPFFDQYVLQVNNETQIYWNDPLKKGELIKSKSNWADKGLFFSNRGTFMVTQHDKGYATWGQENFSVQARFKHPNAIAIEWSPEDTYVMTYSEKAGHMTCKLWDVRSNKNIKSFEFSRKSMATTPVFKWAPNEEFFARIELGERKNKFMVYSTATFKPLRDSYFKIDNVADISWSPKVNKKGHALLAYWVPDVNSIPARIVVLNVNTMKEMRFKNMYNVSNVQMKWHPSGAFLAILVERQRNDVITSSLEIFRMEEKSIPIESIQYQEKVVDFNFEPNGTQLAVIIEPNEIPSNGITGGNKTFELIALDGTTYSVVDTIDNLEINNILWSPAGRYLVFVHQQSGKFEFWDCDPKSMPVFLKSAEEYKMSNASWDPSGRYFSAIVSVSNQDDGFSMWNVVGKKLYERRFSCLNQFMWRPRPPVFLSDDKLKKVKRTLNSKIKQYKKDEQKRVDAAREKEGAALKKQWDDFVAMENSLIAQHKKEANVRKDLRGYASDDETILYYEKVDTHETLVPLKE